MKAARVVVLIVAVSAGGLAALLAGRSGPSAPPPPKPVAQMQTVEVLVARSDIAMGQGVGAQDLQWQVWPADSASASFIRRSERPDAIQSLAGAVARTPFASGEPIREAKLIKANGSGFMAALIPAGMRAISTEISPETGAGGFILPNDHVDVILSRRDREAEKNGSSETHTSEVILTNVRVLAIDQNIEEKGGQKVVVGKTATLELGLRQAEMLALARQQGTLTLALRSLADARSSDTEEPEEGRFGQRFGRVNLVRFGVSTTTARK